MQISLIIRDDMGYYEDSMVISKEVLKFLNEAQRIFTNSPNLN